MQLVLRAGDPMEGERLAGLVDLATQPTNGRVPPEVLKEIKRLSKTSDALVQTAFEALRHRLMTQDSQVREDLVRIPTCGCEVGCARDPASGTPQVTPLKVDLFPASGSLFGRVQTHGGDEGHND